MSIALNKFEETGKETYQVTQAEWVEIYKNHMIEWYIKTGIIDIKNRLEANKIESECFHRDNVRMALEKEIEVSEEVLKDYIGLKEQIQKKKEEKEKIPVFTQDIFNTLQKGNKITVNGYKLTVYNKNNNSLIARVYKKQKQAIELLIGERYNIVVGW